MLPDVTCDFSQVQIEEIKGREKEAVLVKGVKGSAPSNDYKVSATYADGYRVTAVCPIGGPWASEKANRTAKAILKRTQNMFKQLGIADYTDTLIQVVGSEQTYGPNAYMDNNPREVMLWLAAHHSDKRALEILSREVAPAGTGMAPGFMTLVGGRPRVSPVLKLFSFLYPKDKLQVKVHCDEHEETITSPVVPESTQDEVQESVTEEGTKLETGTHTFCLGDLAYTRSGDKGNTCNIGVVARHPFYVPYLRQALTEEAVQQYFDHLIDAPDGRETKSVTRYELPGVYGFNFVLDNALGGGGIASLRCDAQGKAYGQMFLDFKIENVPDLPTLAKKESSGP
ncbi:uncharacterized protein [Ptychodera flava]|uniref:uncharacterized protein n=1 Tax=Ptychodera flava TaxID=63121 RepID=UPI00396A8656